MASTPCWKEADKIWSVAVEAPTTDELTRGFGATFKKRNLSTVTEHRPPEIHVVEATHVRKSRGWVANVDVVRRLVKKC